MDPAIWLLRSLPLPVSQTESLLGRITKNIGSPGDDFVPPNDVEKNLGTIEPLTIENFQLQAVTALSQKHKAFLEGVAGYKKDNERSVGVQISTTGLHILRVQQHGELLRSVIGPDEVRSTINSWTRSALVRGPPVVMIVGVLICDNATWMTIKSARKTLESHAKFPLATLVTATAGLPFIVPFGDVAIEAQNGQNAYAAIRGTLDGQIIGLEYRIVRRATWRNDVKLRTGGRVINNGTHLGSMEAEVEFEQMVAGLEDVDLEIGGEPY